MINEGYSYCSYVDNEANWWLLFPHESIQFWYGFIPVNGGGRIYPRTVSQFHYPFTACAYAFFLLMWLNAI